MSSPQKLVKVSDWCTLGRSSDFTIWPIDHSASHYAEMKGRLTLNLNTGCADFLIRPTAEDARALIAALQWALQPQAEGGAS